MPEEGYTTACSRMLERCAVELGVDFVNAMDDLARLGRVVYSGSLDELCGFSLGRLPYRGMRFENRKQLEGDAQGCSVINYTAKNVPFVRAVEYKHLHPCKVPHSSIVYEFPETAERAGERFYPINNDENNSLHDAYETMVMDMLPGCITGGRMGSYRYYDMHQAIAMGIAKARTAMA